MTTCNPLLRSGVTTRTNRQGQSAINDLWYKNAIIYCLFVGTYMDANGDGIGDFIGLTRPLDYLQGLGITAIWLMPFQVSPGCDNGYHVADYYGVDVTAPSVIFVEFTHAAEQRGIRVLIDVVVNQPRTNTLGFPLARNRVSAEEVRGDVDDGESTEVRSGRCG